jgi:hypothetical protein
MLGIRARGASERARTARGQDLWWPKCGPAERNTVSREHFVASNRELAWRGSARPLVARHCWIYIATCRICEGSMALYIRDDAVRQLARELAKRQGQSVTETVRAALLQAKAKLEQDQAARDAKARAVIEELRAMRRGPVREDAIYDDQGQPRL